MLGLLGGFWLRNLAEAWLCEAGFYGSGLRLRGRANGWDQNSRVDACGWKHVSHVLGYLGPRMNECVGCRHVLELKERRKYLSHADCSWVCDCLGENNCPLEVGELTFSCFKVGL